MKKIISLTLVLMLLASLSLAAFADEPTGTITITNAATGNVYEIYKMLDLSLSDDRTAYTYTINSQWVGFFTEGTGALDYVTVNEANAVSWKVAEDDSTLAAFAKLALEFAQANDIAPIKSTLNDATDDNITFADGTCVFSGLELGYYLVDSTMGALCGLTTTNPNASIKAKNGAPTIAKHVQEDSTNQWLDANTADIGQTINYRVTITVHAGAQNYVLHDVMEEGLVFNPESVAIQHIQVANSSEPHDTPVTYYKVVTDAAELTDNVCDFEIVFEQEFCDKLSTNDKILVYYTAHMNHSAEIYADTNDNTAWLTFGENDENEAPHKSNEATVSTKTFGFDLVKTDAADTPISGAKFKLYDSLTGGKELYVKKVGSLYIYDASLTSGEEIEVDGGIVRIVGLDNGTYYLQETQQPEGYNMLTARKDFTISDNNLDANLIDSVYQSGTGVQVINNTGSRLPETGGLGTLLFTILGGGTAMGTGVVLVTKKRMSKIEDDE